MKILEAIQLFFKNSSLKEIIKFVLIASLFIFIALLLLKFVLLFLAVAFLIRLISPYLGTKSKRRNFNHKTSNIKIVTETRKNGTNEK